MDASKQGRHDNKQEESCRRTTHRSTRQHVQSKTCAGQRSRSRGALWLDRQGARSRGRRSWAPARSASRWGPRADPQPLELPAPHVHSQLHSTRRYMPIQANMETIIDSHEHKSRRPKNLRTQHAATHTLIRPRQCSEKTGTYGSILHACATWNLSTSEPFSTT